ITRKLTVGSVALAEDDVLRWESIVRLDRHTVSEDHATRRRLRVDEKNGAQICEQRGVVGWARVVDPFEHITDSSHLRVGGIGTRDHADGAKRIPVHNGTTRVPIASSWEISVS